MPINGTALLVVLGIAISLYLGEEAVKGIKLVGHKTKCGIERVVGKRCDMPPDPKP